jgi:hypothetical protein
MIKWIALILFSLQFSLTCFAEPASYDTRLIKLSKSIRGTPPSMQDRQSLQAAVASGSAESYLQIKAQEYLKSPLFTLKLKQKVDELMRFIPQTAQSRTPETKTGDLATAYDTLVLELISANKSWDQLLTNKTYSTYEEDAYSQGGEAAYYETLGADSQEKFEFNDVFKTYDPHYDGTLPPKTVHNFAENDPRLAGVLTTPRFFNRYVNTALNKNRRRAAAVYRIFLCDTMIPSVPATDSKSQMTDFDKIFPNHSGLSESQIRKSAAGNIHGQQADCMKCHYKLDPLGQTFGFSATTLAPMPSPGALRYQGYDGRKVDIRVGGLAELGKKITEQPEYAKCQVSNFWRWYIGKDVNLSATREEDLIKVFNKVGRKPQDFISYLVTLPEFKEKPAILTEDQLLARGVVKIFKNCNSCHDTDDDADVPDLTNLPYSKDPRRREGIVNAIKKELDIEHNGAKATMPPKDSLWKLSQDEFATIQKWITRGAPDFQGVPQVTPSAGGGK